jgi:glutamate---cysteine ligase / carboxylate-amine ligase
MSRHADGTAVREHGGGAAPSLAAQGGEPALAAFSAYGIELEYAIVDRESLAVRPIAADLFERFSGGRVSAVDHDGLGWSNELVAHVVEVKNLAPTPRLESLASDVQAEVRVANHQLAPLRARLMPTGMHPWMDPRRETALWQDDGHEIYATYDRIFDCRRHGWSNLQSMHINLPFADDAEFARLHAAVRLVLPLLPALAASSPLAEGRATGFMDYRLDVYRHNADRVPALAGDVIPETVESRADYERRILEPMYREIAPLDPAGVLRYEWLNSRGAIARFDRNAIEVRLADAQECPQQDIAIAAATIAVIEALYAQRWSSAASHRAIATERLRDTLVACTTGAEETLIEDAQYLRLFGLGAQRCRADELWRHLLAECADARAWWRPRVAFILDRGTLARRILRAHRGDMSHARMHEVYGRLCECLDRGAPLE